MIKGLLFDFNGTLFFDSEYHFAAFGSFYKEYGLPTPNREYMTNNIFGRTNEELFPQQFKKDATKEEISEFGERKESRYRELCIKAPEKIKLADGVEEMLYYLKENSIPYCIATGSPYSNIKFYIEEMGLGRWFSMDNIVYCDNTFPGKPAPDIYIRAAEKLGLTPAECAVFEDGTSGIRAATAAKAAKIIAVWEQGLPSPLTPDTHVDGEYHDFLQWRSILSDIGII